MTLNVIGKGEEMISFLVQVYLTAFNIKKTSILPLKTI